MTSTSPSTQESPGRWVAGTQMGLLIGFSLFAASVILWIARLMYVSWMLHDVFSASIGIALIAVPVFLFLLVMFNYVFWGLRAGRTDRAPSAGHTP